MSLVTLLKAEIQTWRSAWQQIETFLDRIDSAKESDAPNADKMKAMLQIAAVIEQERRLRNGTALDPPLEIAEQRGAVNRDDELGAAQLYAPADPTDAAVAFKTRLPGAYDVEIAVAPLKGLLKKVGGSNLEIAAARYAELLPNAPLFSRFDDAKGTWVPVVTPDYDFGEWLESDFQRLIDVERGLFPTNHRQVAALQGFADADNASSAVLRWTQARDIRRALVDKPIIDQAIIPLLQVLLAGKAPDDTTRQSLYTAAKQASDVCTTGAKILDNAMASLNDLVFYELDPSFDFASILAKGSSDLKLRAATYGRIRDAAAALAGGPPHLGSVTPTTQLSKDQAVLLGYGDVCSGLYSAEGTAVIAAGKVLYDSRGAAGTVLDEAITARVEYPDGTLRILRMLEWTFNRAWYARLVWFTSRKTRYLDPLLITRFLGTFLKSLSKMVGSLPNLHTGTSFQARILESAPLVTGSTSLKLAPRLDGTAHNLAALHPGEVVVIEGDPGERRALAVILGPDTPTGGVQRLRISPIRISMTGKLPAPAIAGMIGRSKLDDGPVKLDDAGLHDGIATGAPGDDGVAEELVALWSRLCLVLGGEQVRAALKTARPGSTGELPTFLSRTLALPVDGPITPHTQKLVLQVAALKKAGFDLDGPTRPIIARPGELLLLAGTDEQGHAWQGVIDVLSIIRTTPDKINDDPVLPPAGAMICCQGPGTVIVIQVNDTTFPVALQSKITIHRDFQGFGAPSLATGILLPAAIDPRNVGETTGPYRGPELKAACDVLSGWMWQAP